MSVTEYRMTVQSLSHVQLFVTPRTAAHQASLSFTTSWSLLRFMSIESVMSFNHLILYCPLLLLSSIFPSIRVFSNSQFFAQSGSSGSFLIVSSSGGQSIGTSASNEYSELISLRIDQFDLLAVLGTQESSPSPQFESISSSALSLLYGPTLTSIHDYWKNRRFNYKDLCWQHDVSVF